MKKIQTTNIKKMQKIKKYAILLGIILFPFHIAQAVCPVCTVAVGAGVGLTRYLGIDDAVTGVWIGGLIMSLVFWTIDWLNRKNWHFPFRNLFVLIGYFVLTLLPLYWMGVVGHPSNVLCGIDKLILGALSGSIGLVVGVGLNLWLKKRNSGRVYFPFQKVAAAIVPLFILSLVFYIISKC